ncbi:TM235 protein, partial [Polypterus senegalus]
MKGRLGVVVLLAGLSGIGSFSFLATAIWSEYWYIIQVNKPNITDSGELDSHSGLWNNCEGLFTLSGVSIYIAYSQLAYQESVRTFGPQRFAYVSISFGWSLAVAWLSFAMEVVTGLLLLMAAKITSP